MADIWLKASYPLGPFTQPPLDQAVADVLANAPCQRYGRLAFTYEFVDRPEANTAFLTLFNPPTRSVPADGLRYLYTEPNEHRTLSQHTVAIPISAQNPSQTQRIQVELECFSSFAGHFPPVSPTQPLQPGSPELRLTRSRKRWRITNGNAPGLWFFFWGRDESGGLGQPVAQNAPPGWDRAPVRAYPLVKPPNVPAAPIFPFPAPAQFAAAAAPPGTPQARPQAAPTNPQASQTPAQTQQLASAANPYLRQQQLAALAGQTPLAMSTSNPTLEARQQQYQAQQAQQALAAQQGRATGAYPDPRSAASGYPYTVTPQQLAQAQHAQLLAAQQAATTQTPVAPLPFRSRKPVAIAPASAASSAPAATTNLNVPPQHKEATPLTDILDVLTPQQLAAHRFVRNHDFLAPLCDPWATSAILAGEPRTREVDELAHSNGISSRTGEPRAGTIPGLGRDGPLSLLGTSAARIAVYSALGKTPEKITGGMSVEDRRGRLQNMLEELEKQTDEAEKKHKEQLGKVRLEKVTV
ncbi:hypothetical protein JCM11641_002496 [Rhodosporidiobolus odoratus]